MAALPEVEVATAPDRTYSIRLVAEVCVLEGDSPAEVEGGGSKNAFGMRALEMGMLAQERRHIVYVFTVQLREEKSRHSCSRLLAPYTG